MRGERSWDMSYVYMDDRYMIYGEHGKATKDRCIYMHIHIDYGSFVCMLMIQEPYDESIDDPGAYLRVPVGRLCI